MFKKFREVKTQKREAEKFLRQYDYAVKILYSTFNDTLIDSMGSDSPDLPKQQFLLLRAVYEVLGFEQNEISGYSPGQQKIIKQNRSTIDEYIEGMVNTRHDIREFIFQTLKMVEYFNALADSKYFDSKSYNQVAMALSSFGFGDEFTSYITPEIYDNICEAVAIKTDSLEEYRKILRGKN